MAATENFPLRIVTAGEPLFEGEVTEVNLPAFDGARGLLAAHQDFIGLLGTGVLKLVQNGNDYWFMISSGVYEVSAGTVTILAEVGEAADAIDVDSATNKAAELEPQLVDQNTFTDEYKDLKIDYDRSKARIAAYRRTHLVN